MMGKKQSVSREGLKSWRVIWRWSGTSWGEKRREDHVIWTRLDTNLTTALERRGTQQDTRSQTIQGS